MSGTEWGDEWGSPWGQASWILERAKSRISTILRSLPGYMAQVEWAADMLLEVYAAKLNTADAVQLATSFGKHLDLHGAGIVLSRKGLDDATYKQSLMVRNVALFFQRSSQVLRHVLDLLTEGTSVEYRVYEYHPLVYQVELRNITQAEGERWAALLRTAKPDGIGLIVSVALGDSSNWFRFDSGPGLDQGHYADAVGGG